MKIGRKGLIRGIFGVLTAGAIGFGATQAFASPSRNPECTMNDPEFCAQPYCTYENDIWCAEGCSESWGGGTGACDFWYGMKTCTCWGS